MDVEQQAESAVPNGNPLRSDGARRAVPYIPPIVPDEGGEQRAVRNAPYAQNAQRIPNDPYVGSASNAPYAQNAQYALYAQNAPYTRDAAAPFGPLAPSDMQRPEPLGFGDVPSAAIEEEPQAEPKRSIARGFAEFLVMVAIVLGLAWLMHTFLFQAYEIPSGSMQETIMVGDRVISEKLSYSFGEPKQGDIITFDDPTVDGRFLIKRCIAVGGQTVDLRNGAVYVDGAKLDEPYTRGLPSYPLNSKTVTYPYTVPEGYIWMMGDNRTNSQDSRYFGAIPVSSVTGKAVAVYWPLESIGPLN